jgi:hypothetical protein
MKDELFTIEYILKRLMRFRSKRTFRLCCGQLERLKPRKKIFKIGLSWVKEALDMSFLSFFRF